MEFSNNKSALTYIVKMLKDGGYTLYEIIKSLKNGELPFNSLDEWWCKYVYGMYDINNWVEENND